MINSIENGWCRLALVAALLAVMVGSAAAMTPQTAAQQKCAAAYYKALGKLAKTSALATRGCLTLHAKGVFPSLEECLADPDDRLAGLRAKVEAKLRASCDGNDKEGLPRLPSFGMPAPPTADDVEFAVLFSIFVRLSETFALELDEVVADFGDKPLAQCQIEIHNRQAACVAAHVSAFAACAKKGLKGKASAGTEPFVDADELATCVGSDPKGKIAKSCDATTGKIATSFEKKCTSRGVDPGLAVPACAATGPTAVACTARVASCSACGAIVDAAALDSAVCVATCNPAP